MLDRGVLGIDIGSVSIALALVDGDGAVLKSDYRFHKGNVRESLHSMLEDMGPAAVAAIAVTTSSPPLFVGARSFDHQLSLIAASRHFHPAVQSILYIGGERFGLIRLDSTGAYCGARTNSSCAAGTGSFLDQQARRLGFASSAELAGRACAGGAGGGAGSRAAGGGAAGGAGEPPRISTRCAVFARTDLVHAQQAGYSLDEICDGLCRGLAQNIADTLFGGEEPPQPMVFAGGVARNDAVRKQLEKIIGAPILTHPHAPRFGAIGAALCAVQGAAPGAPIMLDPELILAPAGGERSFHYAPLEFGEAAEAGGAGEVGRAAGADGAGDGAGNAPRRGPASWVFATGGFSARHPVEVEIFSPRGRGDVPVRMGIDVGSTSTKAIIVDDGGEPVAGFYTRTLGSPLTAVQAICEAMESHQAVTGARFRFDGVATTGAGRRFVGTIVKADLVVDEITAHARAAYALDPAIDTIIEIGGQDAKFTTMRNGMVTFSHMNTVCAAGTGSFLEEQAERLGCPLSQYEEMVRGARAPLSSDRCAVFMERDINTFLAQGFSTGEILAAALRSVRENYLSKVARGGVMGEHIAFQGATARNRALVAAFEEGLGKRLHVSRYCHLTGALGAALLLSDRERAPSSFIGLAALRGEIPVRAETCSLCANHCRLRVATVAGETVAYGFLCGRDYDVARYVERNRSGFDLLKERKRAFAAAAVGPAAVGPAVSGPAVPGRGPVVGIPAALGLMGQLGLWERFFGLLGIPVVTSADFTTGVEAGREVQGAEFCAPVAALHGHVAHLLGEADWIFLPWFFEGGTPGSRDARVHCYYTQYSTALITRGADPGRLDCFLSPALRTGGETADTARELSETLCGAGAWQVTRSAVVAAYAQAEAEHGAAIRALQRRFLEETARGGEPSVVLLGRAYNVLSPEMGKGIPGMFGSLGIKCFFQDMVPCDPSQVSRIRDLLSTVHWVNAAKLLEVACVVADTPNLYPVYITSFKCSPDSFVIEYFRRILDAAGKPWLVLQLDDHDSTLGYETRIEAGVASFRNHAARTKVAAPGGVGAAGLAGAGNVRGPARARTSVSLPIVPRTLDKIDGRTLLLPNWDPLANPLLCANLRREGLDARLLEEDPLSIRRAMRHNTGQCLPVSIIMQEAVDYVRRHDLDPARTALWVPRSRLSCNLGMFTPFMKSLLEAAGGGMERMEVYPGDFFYRDVSIRAALNAYKAYLVGGLLRRAGCRLRPAEKEPGATDRTIAAALAILVPGFEGRRPRRAALREAAALFDGIPVDQTPRPRAAIFGDMYVRDNEIMNQGLVRTIESAGGEAVTTPYTEYVRIVASAYFRRLARAGNHLESLTYRALWLTADTIGSGYAAPFARFLPPSVPADDEDSEHFLEAFGLRPEHLGESFENLLKIHHLVRAYPDLALFVQASPGFCCPSLVTEAMARRIERLTGVPVVSITYDGTGQYKNDALVPYLALAGSRQSTRRSTPESGRKATPHATRRPAWQQAPTPKPARQATRA